MFNAAVTEGNAHQDNSLCAFSVQGSQLFSIHLIFSPRFNHVLFKIVSEVFLSHSDYNFAKTNQHWSIYSAVQSAKTQGIGQRLCLFSDRL